jgi:CDGSH-type Zn-finger protein
VAERLTPVISALAGISATLAAHLPAARSHARAAGMDQATLAAQLSRAADLARRALEAHGGDGLADLADRADAARRAVQEGATADRSPGDVVWEAAQAATRVRAARAGAAAPELAEATAVLQSLACELARPQERAERRAELWRLQGSLPAGIQTARNGPYLATNVRRVLNYLGEQIPLPPQVAFCRCGGSAAKPFCDGACASNGFTDAKDPKRVPNRLDTYDGVQVTVLDNRGTCQHSGLCTDRLATVFRAGQEPFVAPSGARMDEIVSVVRNCPSGALSLAFDGQPAPGQTDWGDTREPAIEVTKDGPYRVTGGIELTDADGTAVPRNDGASLEHYAVCRCGRSQNKPFCSGMHWYIDFKDPVRDPDTTPTLFEWAGGLPALTRMTRIFYEKHVPQDPLLAPLFANMSTDHPVRVARWLGEVFGGPKLYSKTYGGYDRMISQHLG